MPVRVPDRLREVWGDELVVELAPWLQEMIREYAVPRDEYREVLSRLDRVERDVSLTKEEVAGLRVEMGKLRDQLRAEYADGQAQIRAEFREDLGELRREVHTGFNHMHARFDEMGARFEGRLDEMNNRMLVQTRWLIGSISVLGTVITVLLAIAQFTP
jgi:tetrahydromethanopterin S-methyltransferase subunit G